MMGLGKAGAAALAAVTLAGMAGVATPAQAQFYLQSRDLSGTPVTSDEPGILSTPMPGATAEERRAGVTWTMRAALNVAALQCQFERTLLTLDNYNAVLLDHRDELAGAFTTLTKYFARTAKTKQAGQQALDQFGTRTYASVTPVASQLNFCEVANRISRDAVWAPRGTFGALAENRIRELRNSLKQPWGEQRFAYYIGREGSPTPVPRLDSICWDKKARWQTKKCGVQNWPPAGIGVATR